MIIENNVKKIVTLCHKIGDRGPKFSHGDPDACQYFPNSANPQLDKIDLTNFSIINLKDETN
jgi:hypothetical protein